jgi:hypothetical protein
MVSQPAYIANLKEYARRRMKDYETEGAELIANYNNESDRGAIILAATNIEDVLEMQITSKLPALAEDEPARKKIFEHDGLISSFSKKIEMAYVMGIIDKAYRKKIDLIREIRNACAHARFPLAMDKQVLRDACKALLAATSNDLKDHEPLTLRNAFLVECTFIANYILTGEKIEGYEAQMRHYQELNASGMIT